MNPDLKAFNQLISVIAGKAIAQQTAYLKFNPLRRCSEAIKITSEIELKQSLQILHEKQDDSKYKQVQRKLESLTSLQRLSRVFKENETR